MRQRRLHSRTGERRGQRRGLRSRIGRSVVALGFRLRSPWVGVWVCGCGCAGVALSMDGKKRGRFLFLRLGNADLRVRARTQRLLCRMGDGCRESRRRTSGGRRAVDFDSSADSGGGGARALGFGGGYGSMRVDASGGDGTDSRGFMVRCALNG